MPKKFLKRWMPAPEKIHGNPSLSFLGKMIHDPNLFHLNRHSVSVAFFAGLFIAFLPIWGQIPLAAIAALRLRCNLPITVLLVWVSNPLTFPIIYFAEYKVGADILLMDTSDFYFELSWEWFNSEFPKIWQPLLFGSIIFSLFFGCSGYLAVQWFWRWHVARRWRLRKLSRKLHK
jgi:uncharacterized protein (DUF2062 family)